VVQAASVGFNADQTLTKLADLAADAASRGAKLAVFPEAFVGGYPKGLDFGATIGNRTAEGKDDFVGYYRQGGSR
jgi:nitrilase